MSKQTLCPTCGKSHNNPKFCSLSCAAKFTNKTPKRKKVVGACQSCGCKITRRNKFCKECRTPDKTLKELLSENVHRSSAFAKVRGRARNTPHFKEKKCCEKCGYDKHVECCHIKPISNFPETTLVSIINAPENIMALCPNCHWELDHNL